jgi:tetratricopeptide (TPR) repeat protein
LAKAIKEVTIPSTIQDVIMDRGDSLPEGAKEVLQNGSLIEREFGYELIKQVTDLAEPELLAHLSVLKDAELLYERGIYPQSTYIFKHALTQEVVHDSILTRKRKQLHEVIGNAIEQFKLFPFWINLWKIAIARLKVFSNDQDINLSKVFEYHGNIKAKVAKGWAARYVAEILLNMDNRHLSEAEDWARKALEADERNGTMCSLACDYVFYGDLYKRKGHQKIAKENLNSTIEIFTECGAEGWQSQAEEKMAMLS